MSESLKPLTNFPDGYLADEKISHDSPPFKRIMELHETLWAFVRLAIPGAGGHLDPYVQEAYSILSRRASPASPAIVEAERRVIEAAAEVDGKCPEGFDGQDSWTNEAHRKLHATLAALRQQDAAGKPKEDR